MPLQTFHISASVKGLSSVSTLIVGSKSAVLIDPPMQIPDAKRVVDFIKKNTSNPLTAIFVTHHHPDHYFSANTILEAYPSCKLYAAPYVRAGIDREYDAKVEHLPEIFGAENMHNDPRKPESYPYSFFQMEGESSSPIMLLGPVQGDSVDHTLFWLPTEKTVITGDALYGRSTHVWAEEIETPQILNAWQNVIELIESLAPEKIIVGHLEEGWTLDAAADLEHNKKYLALFKEKITSAKKQPAVKDIYDTFKEAFPQADKNLDFFLGHLSNQFGEGGDVWEENKLHDVGSRTAESLEGYRL